MFKTLEKLKPSSINKVQSINEDTYGENDPINASIASTSRNAATKFHNSIQSNTITEEHDTVAGNHSNKLGIDKSAPKKVGMKPTTQVNSK